MARGEVATGAPTAAAAGYWRRRGLHTEPERVVLAPGGSVLLLALLAAVGPGAVVLPRPCADWYEPQARLLGRPVHHVPVPAECGGVPDPFALLETVCRARAAGADPRVLVLSVADDPTGTCAPPELLHEVCEAAASLGLLIISDESGRDTTFDPHETVIVSPAQMLEVPGGLPEAGTAVVLVDLREALLPDGPPAAAARFPHTRRGAELARAVERVLLDLGVGLAEEARGPVAVALEEPEALRTEHRARVRARAAYGARLHRALVEAGAVCRPPRLGGALYADLSPFGPELRRRGATGSASLEAELTVALGGPWVRGGHRLGEPPQTLRARFDTQLLAPARPGPDRAAAREPEPAVGRAAWEPEASRRLRRLLTSLTGTRRD
ncbi:aminotransferase class I/II-fold pyridoxal phosphate-dependent enzyme [Streptomyces sp. XM4193]|uniref:aminotransferase class I/II-fold pyridoxal phosphate-dependent enzyme n=1 Tax=Streptomyces sp. XM4193 TaxID=2929782 RepID=UPI001FF77E79|nr:aminotransferase class I/II-fold pyridoxal phosphate-dependent enzyme [Streptomyces sp. XM4193]MCK1797231.1 aminotransferase class I/II-fold pyridoxal phosphate-dependent enzyme [Streptomyces sp. XM4193]